MKPLSIENLHIKNINPFLRNNIKSIINYSRTNETENMNIIIIMKELVKKYYNKRLKSLTITDATACAGYDTRMFSNHFKNVNSVEINPNFFSYLQDNIINSKVKNVKLYYDDYTKIYNMINQDIIYIDPPWGGPTYIHNKKLDLSIGDYNLSDFIKILLYTFKDCLLFIKVPKNFNKKNLPPYTLYKINNIFDYYVFDILFFTKKDHIV